MDPTQNNPVNPTVVDPMAQPMAPVADPTVQTPPVVMPDPVVPVVPEPVVPTMPEPQQAPVEQPVATVVEETPAVPPVEEQPVSPIV
jgi:hypothetical protein